MKRSTATVRMRNLPLMYSRAHVGFCKRCCPMMEKEVSALRLLIGLQKRVKCFSLEK